jgi:ABC-type transport system substrate-binding protein
MVSSDGRSDTRSRRWLLRTLGAGTTIGIAGCTGNAPQDETTDGGGGGSTTESDDGGGDTETTSGGGESGGMATFTNAKSQPLTHLDPQAINDGTLVQLGLVYDQLMDYAPEDPTTLRPQLATSWEPQNGGEEWVFGLREGVTFGDGTKFDAYAARRSLERAKNLTAGQSKPYDWIDSVEETGDYEITIHCNGAFGPAPSALSFITASIMNPTLIDEHKDDENLGHEFFKTNVDGTGPYELETWDKGNEFVVTLKDSHWRADQSDLPDNLAIPDNANIGRYRNSIVREQLTQKQQLARGDIDLARDLTWTNMREVVQEDGVNLYEGPTDIYNKYVFMMCQREPTSDVHFRKALAYAADYKGIAEELVNTAVPWGTPWPEGIWPRVTEGRYSRDLEKARQHLEQSVYGGEELTFRSIKGSENDKVGEALVANFDEIGVTVDHEDIPWADLYEQLTSQESMPDLLMYNGWPDYPDPNGPAVRYWGDYWPPDGWNTAYYKNEEYDEMFVEARSTGDREKRAELYTKMQELVIDEVPIIWLFQNKYVRAKRKSVTNMTYTPGELQYIPVHKFNKEQ